LSPRLPASALKTMIGNTGIYRRKYRQIQANMNSQKNAYVPICDFEDPEKVHIFVGIQANTEMDHANVHIYHNI
jgi:hypothetical protein